MVNITSSKLAHFSLLHANQDPVDICKDSQGRKKKGEFNTTGDIWGLGGGFGWGVVWFCLITCFMRNSFLGIRCCVKGKERGVKIIAGVNVEGTLNCFLSCVRVEESVTCISIYIVARCIGRYVALSRGLNPPVQAPTAGELCAAIAPVSLTSSS